MYLILFTVLFILAVWIYGFSKANDLLVPTIKNSSIKKIKKVLIIFPHPDDEANSLSGTITQFVKNKTFINWIVLSKGERGNDDAHYDESLKEIRVAETRNVANILDINNLTIKDYPDNEMDKFEYNLKTDLKQIIRDKNPDLVITYDESGGYGHPDHVIVSKVVTSLINNKFPNIGLWYVSTPKKLFDELKLPEQMAKDIEFKTSRKYPSFKVWVGLKGIINKIKVIYAYQSQFNSFVKSVPIKQIPMWFYISLTPYEYFYEAK